MKTPLVIIVFALLLHPVSGISKSIPGNINLHSAQPDTSAILQKTDSLAASLLKTWDKNSRRQTGVPLSTGHFDRKIYIREFSNAVIVTYRFSNTKFYGPTGRNIDVPEENYYPFSFDIAYEFDTNECFLLPAKKQPK